MNANRVVNRMAIAAIVFGGVTVLTGGRALFGRWEWRGDFGNAVPFVLWFNFLAGMVYIRAGAGLLLCRRWAVYTSLFVAGRPSRGGPFSFSFLEATSPLLFHPSCAISTAPTFLPRVGHTRGEKSGWALGGCFGFRETLHQVGNRGRRGGIPGREGSGCESGGSCRSG